MRGHSQSGYIILRGRLKWGNTSKFHHINQGMFMTCQGMFRGCSALSGDVQLYKLGDVHDLSNYRPISLLSCISKIFEKVLKAQLYRSFIKINILNDSQFGFREKLSTVDAIVSLCESIGKIENCSKTGIFLDFKKAFDTVNHKILLEKLERYGIRGKTLALFENYLIDRFQCIEIDGKFSNFLEMSTGVPQGSVLGPLLFLVYINDLPKVVNNLNKITCFLCADDTSIVAENYDMISGVVERD